MSASNAKPVKLSRRTQLERSESTQLRLMEATLRCLGRKGYASTSISEIIKEAGVSRGALLHHYPSKVDLVAVSIDYFMCERLKRLENLLIGADKSDITLEDRLRVLKEDFEHWFVIGLEIIVALRTNPDLECTYEKLAEVRKEAMTLQYEKLFPEFEDAESPRILIAVIGCFLRGLCLEGLSRDSDPERIETIFQQFVAIFTAYQQSRVGKVEA